MVFSHHSAARLQVIASACGAGQSSPWEAAGAAARLLIEHLGCARVSLWRFERGGAAPVLHCFASMRSGGSLEAELTQLEGEQYHAYFAALIATGVYVSSDARADPRLAPMRAAYLALHDIAALLDVVVKINGRAYGIVCCEQIGTAEVWSADRVSTARAFVQRASLLMAGEAGLQIDSVPSIPIKPLDAVGD